MINYGSTLPGPDLSTDTHRHHHRTKCHWTCHEYWYQTDQTNYFSCYGIRAISIFSLPRSWRQQEWVRSLMIVLRQLWFLLNRGGRMILRQTAQRWIIFVMFRREEFYWILLPLSSRKFLLGIYINISMGWWCMMLIIVQLILFMIVVRSVNTVNIVIVLCTLIHGFPSAS